MSAALLAEVEHLRHRYDNIVAAQRVCLDVIEHPYTDPKLAGQVFLLLRWIGDGAEAVA